MPQQNFIMRKSFFCESHWCFGINECSALEHSGPSVTVPPPILSDSQGAIGWNSHFPLTALLYGGESMFKQTLCERTLKILAFAIPRVTASLKECL